MNFKQAVKINRDVWCNKRYQYLCPVKQSGLTTACSTSGTKALANMESARRYLFAKCATIPSTSASSCIKIDKLARPTTHPTTIQKLEIAT